MSWFKKLFSSQGLNTRNFIFLAKTNKKWMVLVEIECVT